MKKLLISISYFLILICLIIIQPLTSRAQTRVTVTGKVTDSKDKQSVIGASVVELDKDKRTIRGASTDIEGNFAIQVSNPQGQLQISYLGYKTQLIQLNGRTSINISLVPATNEIGEVAITSRRQVSNGTGLVIEERNSTVASSSISAKDLEELSAQSIDQALQGRLPGVDVGTSSGDPGAGMAIRIRGTSSINGSAEPLIVLDGMPYETQIPDDFNFGTADEQGYAQLLNIAPSDIKDITVLKDAASTAVWGSRAANGVLIITTKRGVIGKPIVTYNMKATLSKQPENIPLLNGNQYSMLVPEEINNMNMLPLDITRNPELSYDPQFPAYYYNYSNNSNWIDAITQLGYSHDHNISMQGGGEKARYYASVGYLDQQGTTVGTGLNRITTKINLDYNVSSRIRFRSDFTYTHVNNSTNYSGSLRNVAYTKMPNMAIYQYDEFGNPTPNYFSPLLNIQGQYGGLENGNIVGTVNPLAMAKEATSTLFGERITPKFNLQYDIVPTKLQATFDLLFDINNTKSKTFLPQIASGRPATETFVNRASDSDGDNFIVSTKLNLIYTPSLGENHSLQALLSFQTDDSKAVSQYVLTSNTASSNLQDPADPSRTQNSDLSLRATTSQTRTVGVVVSVPYSFLDRYIVNVGARLDGNSRFGSNYKYGVFPSFSARWRASGESFMKNLTWIDDLSFRLSYGESGKQPSKDYTFYNTYNPTSFTYLGMSGVVPGNIGLDNLKWETNIGRNLGFNLWLLKSRLKLDVEVYKNKIVDLFFDKLQIPAYTGYTQLSANVGTMTNQGFEIGLNTIPYRSKKWIVGFDFNIAQNLNVIREVSEYYPRTDGKRVNDNGIYRTFLQIGNPFGSFYGFRYKGVYKDKEATIATDANGAKIVGPNEQVIYTRFNYPATDYTFQPGDAKYEDVNHDGNINEDDIVYLGNSNPKVTGGFGPNVTFKGNLRIQAFFNYRLGYQLINETLMKTTNMYSYDNQSTLVLGRWRNPGDETNVPRALYRSGYNWLGSDRYVSDGSFVKLRSVTARYTLTKNLLTKLRVKSASVYLTAENLYTWTSYKGVDPDVSTRGLNSPFSYVSDKALTPPSRNILAGLTVGF